MVAQGSETVRYGGMYRITLDTPENPNYLTYFAVDNFNIKGYADSYEFSQDLNHEPEPEPENYISGPVIPDSQNPD